MIVSAIQSVDVITGSGVRLAEPALLSKLSGSQKVALGILEVLFLGAILIALIGLLVYTMKNMCSLLKETWAGWIGAWIGLTIVATLIAATMIPNFRNAVKLGLIIATIAVAGSLLLVSIFLAVEDILD